MSGLTDPILDRQQLVDIVPFVRNGLRIETTERVRNNWHNVSPGSPPRLEYVPGQRDVYATVTQDGKVRAYPPVPIAVSPKYQPRQFDELLDAVDIDRILGSRHWFFKDAQMHFSNRLDYGAPTGLTFSIVTPCKEYETSQVGPHSIECKFRYNWNTTRRDSMVAMAFDRACSNGQMRGQTLMHVTLSHNGKKVNVNSDQMVNRLVNHLKWKVSLKDQPSGAASIPMLKHQVAQMTGCYTGDVTALPHLQEVRNFWRDTGDRDVWQNNVEGGESTVVTGHQRILDQYMTEENGAEMYHNVQISTRKMRAVDAAVESEVGFDRWYNNLVYGKPSMLSLYNVLTNLETHHLKGVPHNLSSKFVELTRSN